MTKKLQILAKNGAHKTNHPYSDKDHQLFLINAPTHRE